MAKLSDLQLASVLEEVACAIRSGTPIVQSMERLSDGRLGRVAVAARSIAGDLSMGKSLGDAFGAIESPLAVEAGSAVEACSKSGNSGLLDSIASHLRQRTDYQQVSRLAWLYPIVLISLAYLIAITVFAPIVRMHQGRDFSWSPAVLAVSQWLATNWMIPPIVFAVVVVVMLVYCSRGGRLPRSVRMRLFTLSLADQLANDIPEREAVSSAAKLSGDTELCRMDSPGLDSPAVKSLLREAHLESVDGVDQQATLVARLRYVSSLYAGRARRHNYLMSRLIPRVAMFSIGGSLIFVYAFWVIAPVYQQVAKW